MKHKRAATVLALAATLIVGTYPAWAGVIGTVSIINLGTITSIVVTAEPDTITWGTLDPDGSKTRAVTLTSTSNVVITLVMTTQDLPSYLSLSWDLEGTQLAPDQSILASFTLTATNAPQGAAFSFNIIITGEG